MGLLHRDHKDAYDTFNSEKNEAHLSHELIAAAAAYKAADAYNDHVKKQGKPVNHEKAKEIFAGLAGFAVTHLAETKGMDAWDEHKRKKAAEAATEKFTSDAYNSYS